MFFGVPGCGKTTVLTALAQKELKKISKGKSKYDRVLTNFECEGCYKIDFNDLCRIACGNFIIEAAYKYTPPPTIPYTANSAKAINLLVSEITKPTILKIAKTAFIAQQQISIFIRRTSVKA